MSRHRIHWGRFCATDLHSALTPTAKELLQRQIDATGGQIDQLVYELYTLTDEEIRIVEERL